MKSGSNCLSLIGGKTARLVLRDTQDDLAQIRQDLKRAEAESQELTKEEFGIKLRIAGLTTSLLGPEGTTYH